jgi:putative endonuclease
MRQHTYFVYILCSNSRVLYIGVTNDLERRVMEHREGRPGSFTTRYNVHRLVHVEAFGWIQEAIAREKQLKRWTRERKIALIEAENPHWRELFPRTPRDPSGPQGPSG